MVPDKLCDLIKVGHVVWSELTRCPYRRTVLRSSLLYIDEGSSTLTDAWAPSSIAAGWFDHEDG